MKSTASTSIHLGSQMNTCWSSTIKETFKTLSLSRTDISGVSHYYYIFHGSDFFYRPIRGSFIVQLVSSNSSTVSMISVVGVSCDGSYTDFKRSPPSNDRISVLVPLRHKTRMLRRRAKRTPCIPCPFRPLRSRSNRNKYKKKSLYNYFPH